MIKDIFTNNVAAEQCDDCKEVEPGPTTVSNLVGKATINSKYDDAWYLKHNPQQ